MNRAGAATSDYFGTTPTPMSFESWLQGIEGRRAAGQRGWVSGSHNLHSLYLYRCRREPDMVAFYARCDDCYLDGMPLRCILAGMGVATAPEQRFTLMDHIEELLARADTQGWRVFYLGATAETVALARDRVSREHPGLAVEIHHGYFDDAQPVIQAINRFSPDLLLLGMGMPRQERWLMAHIDDLDAGTVVQAGATLDYYAGTQARPPRWLGRLGLAWAYRLLHDPVRLARRYLVEPWSLLLPTLRLWRAHRGDG